MKKCVSTSRLESVCVHMHAHGFSCVEIPCYAKVANNNLETIFNGFFCAYIVNQFIVVRKSLIETSEPVYRVRVETWKCLAYIMYADRFLITIGIPKSSHA